VGCAAHRSNTPLRYALIGAIGLRSVLLTHALPHDFTMVL